MKITGKPEAILERIGKTFYKNTKKSTAGEKFVYSYIAIFFLCIIAIFFVRLVSSSWSFLPFVMLPFAPIVDKFLSGGKRHGND